ncbi:MAG: hypothetical protein RLP16_00035 [Alphaproteobacteria bacterium]
MVGWPVIAPFIQKLRELAGIMRGEGVGGDSARGRSRDRYRRTTLFGLAGALSRVIGMITILITVPLTVDYLGAERYGLWMTISSLVFFLALANLGLDTSLLNRLTAAHGRDDTAGQHRAISNAFVLLCGIALVMAMLFLAVYPYVPWAQVFNVTTDQAAREAGPAMLAFVACVLAGLPLGVVTQTQVGFQEGFINGIWESAGRLASLAGILLVIYLEGGLVWLVLATAGIPLVASFVNGLVLFGRRRPHLRPRLDLFHWGEALDLTRQGVLFFSLIAVNAVAFWSDNLIAAHILGPEAVTDYAVAFRMFSLAAVVVALLVNPFWPAFGEAQARGEGAWAARAFGRTVKLALVLTTGFAIVFVVFGSDILRLWVGDAVTVSLSFLIALALYAIGSAAWLCVTVLLNGIHELKFELAVLIAVAISAVIAKLVLAGTLGVAGIAWGNVLALYVFAGIPMALWLPGILRRLRAGRLA